MKFLWLIFIMNLLFGQILPNKFLLKSIKTSELSPDYLLKVTNKLRAQAIFISVFYSKTDFYDDAEYILPLEEKVYFEMAEKFKQVFFSKKFGNFKQIEAFCFLGLIINSMDFIINSLASKTIEEDFGGVIIQAAYLLFLTSLHQFPKLLSKEEISFFDDFYKNVWGRNEELTLNSNYFYRIVSFFDSIIDQIIIQSIDLFLIIPLGGARVYDLFTVISCNKLFSSLNEELFQKNFNLLTQIKRNKWDESMYRIQANCRYNIEPVTGFVVSDNMQEDYVLYKKLLNVILEKI